MRSSERTSRRGRGRPTKPNHLMRRSSSSGLTPATSQEVIDKVFTNNEIFIFIFRVMVSTVVYFNGLIMFNVLF
jgi:hypothetical protein